MRAQVLLVQLPIPPLEPGGVRGNVPLAGAYLKLWAERCGLGETYDIQLLPADIASRWSDRRLVEELVARAPSVLGFTCYLWNIDRTLWIAEAVKRRRPETLVVVGGPEITRDNLWMLNSPGFDYAVFGEGEQTFSELLECLRDQTLANRTIPGLLRRGEDPKLVSFRTPIVTLDEISSPYLTGILNARDQEQLLLETIRGCIFKCKFCYYPKAYDRLYYISSDKILANLTHARENGAREVFLLDPTLNQRRDFTEFLELLCASNADRRLEFHAELRAEGLKPEHARLMKKANFIEVEIGLQSIDPKTQDLMDRHNNLRAFEAGVKALRAEGIQIKVDLIVGLPGDTVDSIRRSMKYVADGGFHDTIQVFQLSILPGTSFREEAEALGLKFQNRPPYYVTKTPTLSLDQMLGLLEEAEEVFDTEFDPMPPPHTQMDESMAVIDLRDTHTRLDSGLETSVVVFRFITDDAWGDRKRIVSILRRHIEQNPFAVLEVQFVIRKEFPLDLLDEVRVQTQRPVNLYLDRFYEFTPARHAGSLRFVILGCTSDNRSLDPEWIDALRENAEFAPSLPGVYT